MNPSSSKEIIQVQDVECRYGDEIILSGISFSVKHGEIFYIAGQSGCGKSTLLRHMVGLMSPYRGRIAYFGRDFNSASFVDRRELLRSFGVLFQELALWTDMSLFENVSLPLWLNTKLPEKRARKLWRSSWHKSGLPGNRSVSHES